MAIGSQSFEAAWRRDRRRADGVLDGRLRHAASASWQRSQRPAERRVRRHVRHVAPAPFAFDAAGALDRSTVRCARRRPGRPQLDLRHDEERRQFARVALRGTRARPAAAVRIDLGLQRAADPLVLAKRLDFGEHVFAHGDEARPAVSSSRGRPAPRVPPRTETPPCARSPRACRQVAPQLVGA